MKKLMVFTLALGLLTPIAVFAAGELEGVAGVTLSNQVIGTYFNDGNSPPTAYQISTGHTQGDRAFASGSSDSVIYYKASDGDTFEDSDLISEYSATAFASGTTWTPLGDKATDK